MMSRSACMERKKKLILDELRHIGRIKEWLI